MALDIASRVSTGSPFPDAPAAAWRYPGGQVLFAADGPTRKRLATRLAAAGAALDRFFRIPLLQQADHWLDVAPVEAALGGLGGGCRLLVLDALRVGLGRDGELDEESGALFESLESLAGRQRVPVLAVVRCPGVANPSHRLLGALASCPAALCAFAVIRDDTLPDRRSLVALRSLGDAAPLVFRLCDERKNEAPRVEWRVEAGEADDRASPVIGLAADERLSAAQWLVRELQHGPRPVNDLKQAALGDGYSWRTVCRAKRRLRVRSTKVVQGQTVFWRWSLPCEAWRGAQAAVAVEPGTGELRAIIAERIEALDWKTAVLAQIRQAEQPPPLGQVGQGGQESQRIGAETLECGDRGTHPVGRPLLS